MTVTCPSPMTKLSLLDEDYWTALEILADEVGNIKDWIAQDLPWHPVIIGDVVSE